MEKEEINNLHLDFWGKFKKFMFTYNINFSFSVDTFEKCAIIFDEIGLIKMSDFTENYFYYNKSWLDKLCNQLNIKCSYMSCVQLFELFIYNHALLSEISPYCGLYTGGICGNEPLYDWEVTGLARKNKYDKKYYYEFSTVIDFNILPLLKTFDSIRSTLLKNGDTMELINNRDFAISLHKYYDYLAEGITYGQNKKDK